MQTRLPPLPSPTLDFHEQTTLLLVTILNNNNIYSCTVTAPRQLGPGAWARRLKTLIFIFVVFPNTRHELRTRLLCIQNSIVYLNT